MISFSKNLSLLVFIIFITSCGGSTANWDPSIDLNTNKAIYVVKGEVDDRGVGDAIKNDLIGRGYSVTSGRGDNIPPEVEFLVFYAAHWEWDFVWYIYDLSITFKQRKTLAQVGTARTSDTALPRESKEVFVERVLGNIFSKAAGGKVTHH